MSSVDDMANADDLDDELDIELRPATAVAARAIIVAAVLHRLAMERAETATDEADEAFDLREWLREQRLLDLAAPDERELLERTAGSLTHEEVSRWSWQGEALAALAWALQLARIDPPGVPTDLGTALAHIPSPWDAAGEWRRQARLQPESTIITERERAELWRWRAVTEAARREATPGEIGDIETAIADVVAEVSSTGIIAGVREGDFAVGNQRLRDLAPHDLDDLQAATTERVRALNWLCGFGQTWQDTPVDI